MKLTNILVLAVIVLLTSCGWSEKNHQVSKPYTLSGDFEVVVTKWDTGYRKVAGHKDSATGKWVPMHYVKDSLQPAEFKNQLKQYVDVTPSNSSVWAAAKATGWEWQWKVGAVFIVLALGFLVYLAYPRKTKDGIKLEGTYALRGSAIALITVPALLIVIGLVFILGNPVNKSGNNQKRITKEQYDNIIKTDPNLIQFFDSIQKNRKFVN